MSRCWAVHSVIKEKPCLEIHNNVVTQPEYIEIANTLSYEIALQCICIHRSYRLHCPTDLHYNVHLYIPITHFCRLHVPQRSAFCSSMQSNTSSLFFDTTLLLPYIPITHFCRLHVHQLSAFCSSMQFNAV
jgi:hypothetical protein